MLPGCVYNEFIPLQASEPAGDDEEWSIQSQHFNSKGGPLNERYYKTVLGIAKRISKRCSKRPQNDGRFLL